MEGANVEGRATKSPEQVRIASIAWDDAVTALGCPSEGNIELSYVAGVHDLALAKRARFGSRCSASHHPSLASSGISGLLALEISRSPWQA